MAAPTTTAASGTAQATLRAVCAPQKGQTRSSALRCRSQDAHGVSFIEGKHSGTRCLAATAALPNPSGHDGDEGVVSALWAAAARCGLRRLPPGLGRTPAPQV